MHKTVLACCCGIFCSSVAMEVGFYNNLKRTVEIRQISWTVEHIGPDPYKGRYDIKIYADPYEIACGNKNQFSVLYSHALRLKPGERYVFKSIGSGQVYVILDPQIETIYDECHTREVTEWTKKPFHASIYSEFSIQKKLREWKLENIVLATEALYYISASETREKIYYPVTLK